MRSRASKRKVTRVDDERIIDSSGNVFVDLGFDEVEAEVLKMRAEATLRIEAQLNALGGPNRKAPAASTGAS